MASIKIKFRPSVIEEREGTVYYQVIHNRVARQLKTGYQIYGREWDASASEIVATGFDEQRREYLSGIRDSIRSDIRRFRRIIASLERQGEPYSADDVISSFAALNPQNSFFTFMEEVIANLKKLGKVRTAEAYSTTLNSFRRFREERDIALDKVDSYMMLEYEVWLRANGVSPNSSSFYMRNLRAVYNRAVEKELTPQRFPFKHVYTGIDKTVKKAVPLKVIKKIKNMGLELNPSADFARDMFLFSFYTRLVGCRLWIWRT